MNNKLKINWVRDMIVVGILSVLIHYVVFRKWDKMYFIYGAITITIVDFILKKIYEKFTHPLDENNQEEDDQDGL